MLAGCGDSGNYAGTGNEYRIVGVVNHVQSDETIQINHNQIDVLQAAGKAATWFKPGTGEGEINFDPDYNKHGSGFFGGCENNQTVGQVYDFNGNEIEATDLQPGTVVEIDGSIRSSNYLQSAGKTVICEHKNKNVFDSVRVVSPSEMNQSIPQHSN